MAKARKQDYIVELISVLSANEKRYFKLFCNLQPGDKRYLKLFDALENKNKYESAELCKELNITVKQLTDDKAYLIQVLLQSSRNYSADEHEISVLRNNRENAYMLMKKHLFAFALDIIDKTLVRAQQLEVFELIDDLLFLKARCLTNPGVAHVQSTIPLAESCRINQEKHLQMVELTGLFLNAQKLAFAQNVREFKKFMAHPLLSSGPDKLKSLRAQGMWFSIWQYYYTDKKDLDNLSKREYALYKKRPEIKLIAPVAYINCMFAMWEASAPKEALAILTEMEQVIDNGSVTLTTQQNNWIRFLIGLRKAITFRKLEKYKEGITICETLYNQAAVLGQYFLISLIYDHALMLLCVGKASDAAGKVKDLLDLNSAMRPELQTNARLLYIIITLELENYAVINALVRSTKLWLKKHKTASSGIDLFLKQAGAIARMPNNRRAIYRELLNDAKAGRFKDIEENLPFDKWLSKMASG